MEGSTGIKIHHLIDYADRSALDETLEAMCRLLQADRCSILLRMEGLDEFVVARAKGLSQEVAASTRVKLGEGVAGLVAQAQRPILVKDASEEPGLPSRNSGRYLTESFVSAPVVVAGRTYGVVNAADKLHGDTFTAEDLSNLVLLAQLMATAIRNVVLRTGTTGTKDTDELTGLCSRCHFEKRLLQEIERAKRYRHSLGMLLVDVDKFRHLNQTYGHQTGNAVLRSVASALSMSVRRYDVVARHGPDEFAMLLSRVSEDRAASVAERIRHAAKNSQPASFPNITVAIGASAYPVPAGSAEELIEHASDGLQLAKETGGDTVCCWPEDDLSHEGSV
ncbi:MAG: sensor domain-containing diguanylate cyclase [Chloroflexi bacterium]|nr:sensor domain-containing diguanylate cyclase [Chloroflexota bacterium]